MDIVVSHPINICVNEKKEEGTEMEKEMKVGKGRERERGFQLADEKGI